MKRSRRFELWISGILLVVCLLLLNVLVWQFRKEPSLRLVRVNSVRSVPQGEHPPASSRQPHELRPAEAAVSSTAATTSRLRRQARAARHPLESEQAMHIVLLYPSKASPPAVAPPQPKTITLEPLGYAEKADGQVEAIISLGEHVQVVHEGEIFEDKFRVAKISSSTVELVENSAPAEQAPVMAEVGQGVAQEAARKAGQTNPLAFPEQASNTGAARQLDAASPAGAPKPPDGQELGYVERGDGRVEAIVAEGEHVRLAPATKWFASSFHVPAPSPANLKVANTLPSPINPPAPFSRELQPVRASSSSQEAGGPSLTALGSEPSAVDKSQGIPAGNGESESEPLGSIQPEPLADYSGSRFEPGDVALVPYAGPAGAAPSPATAGSGQAVEDGATPRLLSDGRETESVVNTLGYVEKAGGEKEAIVEVLGQVYLVHEGEFFGGKYRALKVNSFSVQIVEEPTGGSSLPAGTKRDSKAVPPPISRLRGLPVSTGSCGTDPPVEVRKVEELAAAESVVSPSRPPPEHPVES